MPGRQGDKSHVRDPHERRVLIRKLTQNFALCAKRRLIGRADLRGCSFRELQDLDRNRFLEGAVQSAIDDSEPAFADHGIDAVPPVEHRSDELKRILLRHASSSPSSHA